jgi:DtxR family Mn-dependent transcriptional regulator
LLDLPNNKYGYHEEGDMTTQQTASMEDYLKAIVLLSQGDEEVTVTKISNLLRVKKPSVTCALLRLSEIGLVMHKKYGHVALTPEGLKIAKDVYHRHKILCHLLVDILGVDTKVAEDDACRMEHFLSPSSLKRLAKFIEFVLNRPKGISDCLKGFQSYIEHSKKSDKILTECKEREEIRKTKALGIDKSNRNVVNDSKAIK